MIKAIIFDLWETLGTKNIGISKSLQDTFAIEKTADFMDLYETAVQLEKWKSEEDLAINFLKEFNIESSQQNIEYIVNLFRQGVEKAREYGLQGIVFESVEQLQNDLKKLGI